jgi:hypothetical protein
MIIAKQVLSKSGHRKVSLNFIKSRRNRDRDSEINNLNLVEMLNVVKLIEFGMKDISISQEAYSKKETDYANKIIALSRNKKTRPKAERMQKNLFRRIVVENEKLSNPHEGKRLYKKLMREC